MAKIRHWLLSFYIHTSQCVRLDHYEEVAEEVAPIQSNMCEWEVKPQMVAARTSKNVEAVDTEKHISCRLLMLLKEKICQAVGFLVPAARHSPLHHLHSSHSLVTLTWYSHLIGTASHVQLNMMSSWGSEAILLSKSLLQSFYVKLFCFKEDYSGQNYIMQIKYWQIYPNSWQFFYILILLLTTIQCVKNKDSRG